MTKSGVIRCLLSVVLAVYLAMALLISNDMAAREMCRGMEVQVERGSTSCSFVTTDEVQRLLHDWNLDNVQCPASEVNLQKIEDKLNGIDIIEHAMAQRLPDNRIRITVTPMLPVARIFDRDRSYYINRAGKRLTANARFRLDVPVVTGAFDSAHPPRMLLPLIERISNDSAWNAIVAQIMVEPRNHDVILVPMIRGHVINLGDTADIDDKLDRVMTMYHKVLPVKGWNYYDTLSVKWGGQVVASRRLKSIPEPHIRFDQEGEEEFESIDNMLVGDTIGLPEKPRGKTAANKHT
ncbi:MAG: cell division protein FtsQ/DivIB [Muribaculaceae bacterium]|nr:cell division protein FtsQ/DivIB [Muribaculaceae bacterium]